LIRRNWEEADFDISQLVDVVKGVPTRIRLADFDLVEGQGWTTTAK
jgi:hypothetical protein